MREDNRQCNVPIRPVCRRLYREVLPRDNLELAEAVHVKSKLLCAQLRNHSLAIHDKTASRRYSTIKSRSLELVSFKINVSFQLHRYFATTSTNLGWLEEGSCRLANSHLRTLNHFWHHLEFQ